MKKIFLIIVYAIIFFSMIDIAYANTSLSMECDKASIGEGQSTICSLILNTDEEKITRGGFAMNSEALKLDVLSGLNGISSDSSLSTSISGNFKNGDSIFRFKLTAPSKFLSMNYPINITNINLSNGSTKVNESDTYTPTIAINGSVPSSGNKSATLEVECPNYYINIGIECSLILNINNAYFNTVVFNSLDGEVTYNKSDYEGHSYANINGIYNYQLSRSILRPFVGRTTIGKLHMVPHKGARKISFSEVKVSNSYFGVKNGIVTNVYGDNINLGNIEINYTGVDRPVGLTSLTIDNTSVPNFNTNNYTYDVTVNNKSKVNIQGTYLDPNGVVRGLGEVTVKEGVNTFTVKCINPTDARDNVTYTININNVDNRSTVDTLETLSVRPAEINFKKETTSYNTSVPGNVTSVVVSSTLTDSKASYENGFGNRTVNLKYGKNEIIVKVKAEKGNIKEYKVIVDRIDDRSKVNTLSKLSLSTGSINFKPATNNYSVNVKSDVTSVTISSELTDSKSSYENGFGNRTVNLKYGANEVLVKVKAENESVNTYKIVINREDNRSKINTLKSLNLSTGDISFDPNKTNYQVNVNKDVNEVVIKSELTDPKSNYENGFGNRTVTLNPGNNKILIKVKAENESINVYTIDIFKELSQDETKKSAEIKKLGASNNLKENEDGTYTVEIDKGIDKIDLKIELVNENAKYEVIGNENLKDGDTIIVKVTSEDLSNTKEYKILVKEIEIKKDLSNDIVEPKDSKITMPVAIGTFVVGVAVLGLAIIKRKKRN